MAKVQGLTIGIGVDTKEFNSGIKKMDKEIRQTAKEVSVLEKSLQIDFNSERFAEAQKKAQKAIEQTDDKAKALRERLKYLEDTGAVDTDGYRKIQSELISTETKATLLKKKLEEIKDLKIEQLAKKFETVGGGIEKLGQKMMPLSAIATGLLASFAAIGKSTIEWGDTVATAAERVNLSAEEFQKWQYIAMQTDISNQELENGLKRVQTELGKLAVGEVSKGLERMGFTSEQASKGMSGNFSLIVERLSMIEDATEQAGIANEIFGAKLGAAVIPLLNSGAEGIAQLTAEFEALGYVSNEQIAKIGELDNVINGLKYQFQMIKNEIGVALIPIMENLADILNNRILPAIRNVSDWFGNLSEKQLKTMLTIIGVVAALAPMLVIIGKMVSSIGGLVKAFSGLSKVFSLIAAHPIIAIIGVIIGLIILLYNTNEEFKNSIDGLFSKLSDTLMPVLDLLMQTFNDILNAIMPLIENLITALMPVLQMLVEGVMQVIDAILPLIPLLITSLMPVIQTIIQSIIQILNAIMPLVSILITALMPIIQIIIQVFVQLLNKLMPLINILLSILLPVLQKIIEFITPIIEIIIKSLGPVIEWIGGVWAKVFGAFPKVLNVVIKAIESFINGAIRIINKLIDGINTIGNVLGFTIGKLKEVEIKGFDINTDFTTKTIPAPEPKPVEPETIITPAITPEGVIKETNATPYPTTYVNNDYSDKEINFEIVIQNYAEEVDVDNLIRQINMKLAGEL